MRAFVRFCFMLPALKFGLLYEDLTFLHFLIRPSMAQGSRTTQATSELDIAT
jgi:hypothetical protein